MEGKGVDRRVRRTRARLRQALTALLREKELKDITVRELTELADVNRGTFYSHYQDVFDMSQQMEQELLLDLNTLLAAYSPSELRADLRPVLEDVFTFASAPDNRDLVLVMLERQPQSHFFRRLSQLIYDKCLREWQGMYPVSDPVTQNYWLEFLVSGTVGLVRSWARSGFVQTSGEMAALAARIIQSGLRSLQGEEAPFVKKR